MVVKWGYSRPVFCRLADYVGDWCIVCSLTVIHIAIHSMIFNPCTVAQLCLLLLWQQVDLKPPYPELTPPPTTQLLPPTLVLDLFTTWPISGTCIVIITPTSIWTRTLNHIHIMAMTYCIIGYCRETHMDRIHAM